MTPADPPLRILHLASSERWTGVAEPAANLAAAQLAAGHAVIFACIPGSSFQRKLRKRRIPFADGFKFDRRLSPGAIRRDVSALRLRVERDKIDIVHCHLPHDHWIAALAFRRPFSRFLNAPRPAIVRTLHREQPPRADLAHRWLWTKAADLLIAVSQAARAGLMERLGLSAEKVVWIRGAVDLERFHPSVDGAAIRVRYRLSARHRVAGMVARMRPHRGQALLIDAVDQVVSAVPHAVLAMAGRGEKKAELAARVRAHPLREHLRRMGYHKSDLENLYVAFDVAVMLTPGSDGSCRGMLEAMACGKAVIGARTGAIGDAIEPGVNGWLIPPGDKNALAAALIEALGNPERTRAMGAAARRFAEANHTLEAQCAATVAGYRQALAYRS